MVKRLSVLDTELCVGCQSCMFACTRRLGYGGLKGSCIHISSAGGIRKGFIVVVCRACQEPSCSRVCPTDALQRRENNGVLLRVERCIGCGNCVKACPFGAIFWDPSAGKPHICVYCGYCTPYCPYDVLVLEEVGE